MPIHSDNVELDVNLLTNLLYVYYVKKVHINDCIINKGRQIPSLLSLILIIILILLFSKLTLFHNLYMYL